MESDVAGAPTGLSAEERDSADSEYVDASRDFSEIERRVGEFFAKYDPYLYLVDDANTMLGRITKARRLFGAAEVSTARRLEKAHVHEQEGFKDPGRWLSGITGESVGQAAAKLQAARSIEAHPQVSEAFRAGKLSEAQAIQIASAADRCPDRARELVEEAPWIDFGQLKRRCNEVRYGSLTKDDEIARHEQIRKSRFCRAWTDSDGAGRLEAKMTADALAVVLASLGSFETGIFEDARRSGAKESHQAYMADALVAMAMASVSGTAAGSGSSSTDGQGADETSGTQTSDAGTSDADTPDTGTHKPRYRRANIPRALIRVRIDATALLRGHAVDGETCSIPGLGPVPVALVRELLGDAILELVVTKGTDVTTVCSDSRYVAKALRIALEERDPVCVVPGCGKSDPLERDHWQTDFSKDGPTELDNLARLCPWHHHQKTYRGWRLVGPPGQWRFLKPDAPPGADPGSEVPDTGDPPGARKAPPGARRARPATGGSDPPVQPGML